MAKMSIVFRKDKADKDGLCPIFLSIHKANKKTAEYTKIKICPHQWDDKKKIVINHPRATAYNLFLEKKKLDFASDIVLGQDEQLVNKKRKSEYQYISLVEVVDIVAKERINMDKIKPSTYRTYQVREKIFKSFFGKTRLIDIDESLLQKYIQYRQNQQVKNSSIINEVRLIKMCMNYAAKKQIIPYNHISNTELPNVKKGSRIYLTTQEVQTMMNVFLNFEPKIITDTKTKIHFSFFLLGCYLGLRYSDLKNIDVKKLYKEKYIHLTTQKTNEQLRFTLPQEVLQVLEYLISKNENMVKRSLMCYATYEYQLKKIAKMCGIDKHITSHVARHTFAMRMAEMGISIEVASAILGHQDIKTTRIYYKIGNKRIDDEMKKFGY